MKLSVIIPVFNEQNTLEKVVNKILAVSEVNLHEIIIINDGSTDETEDVMNNISQKYPICKCLSHEENRGKGASIRTAIPKITGEVVVIQDADLEYDPSDYAHLISPILDGKADVVYGSRFLTGKAHRVIFFWHSFGNWFLTLLSNMFTNINLTDMETGFKMFRSDILKKIKIEEDRFAFEVEITAKIAKLHCKIYEVGISYSGRTYAEGKKLKIFRDGFSALWSIFKYNIFKK